MGGIEGSVKILIRVEDEVPYCDEICGATVRIDLEELRLAKFDQARALILRTVEQVERAVKARMKERGIKLRPDGFREE